MNDFILKRDKQYWADLESIVQTNAIDLQFISENMQVFMMRRHINQTLAYYELFKKVQHLPGSIAEFGVFFGNGLFTWLNLLETFLPHDRGRKVYGFDDMKGYERPVSVFEEDAVDYITNRRGSFQINNECLSSLISLHNSDNLVPFDKRAILYDGDVADTILSFKEENPGVRFSLVNLDLNLYEPTKFVLENIWHLVTKGGLVIFRGYGSKPWEGESRVVDEFVHGKDLDLNTIEFNNTPGCFIHKK